MQKDPILWSKIHSDVTVKQGWPGVYIEKYTIF